MSSLFNRQDFPMLKRRVHGKPLVYLDSAATTLKPQSVIDAVSQFYSSHYGTVHRAVYQLAGESTAQYNAVREQVQQFLHAKSPDEIIFTKGTTEAINLVAFSCGQAFVQPGDEILISAMEHHSNIVPWQLLCERQQAHLKIIPLLPSGELDLEAYEKLLSPRTKLVSIAHISNVLGVINPIEAIVKSAHRLGAKVFVDGAQSAPHLPVDVQALGCDFFAFSGHKIYGPTGIGILYGKKELLEKMPPYQGGGDMIQTVTFEKTTYQPSPLKFEAGTPLIAEVMGLGAALKYVHSYGSDKIASYETLLIREAYEQLGQIEQLRILGSSRHRASLITFNIEGVHPLDAATLLDLQGIAVRSGHLCAQPLLNSLGCTAALRLSLAPYNTLEEISYFCDTLNRVLDPLRR
ncbi:MAG: cysteine desulfurase [Verrucomicrobia bacterium]|nr:cysteine desulfurase [Verrucomicrobiota bacterium]